LDEWNRYIPPRRPIVPHIRIGERWINILWAALPIGLGLIIFIAVAQELRQIPAVEDFSPASSAFRCGCACSTT
jgi:hypothetical protein